MSGRLSFQKQPFRQHQIEIEISNSQNGRHVRHRSKLQQCYREKWGEEKEKQNPWNHIGKALTQRYNRKFLQLSLEMERKQQEDIQNKDNIDQKDLKQNEGAPKFQIKRKYLSFDYKGRQATSVKSNNKLALADIHNDRLARNYSSTDSHSQKNKFPKRSTKKLKQLIVGDEIKTKETAIGTYFITNLCNQNVSPLQNKSSRQNYKCIYIKKNRKRVCLNPQLQISLKRAKPRLERLEQQMSSVRVTRERMGTEVPLCGRKKKDSSRQLGSDKIFRPWSGYDSDDNL